MTKTGERNTKNCSKLGLNDKWQMHGQTAGKIMGRGGSILKISKITCGWQDNTRTLSGVKMISTVSEVFQNGTCHKSLSPHRYSMERNLFENNGFFFLFLFSMRPIPSTL